MGTTQKRGLFAVLHASSVMESRVEARLADVGLSLAKLAALHRLAEAGESLPLGQLAERLSCVKSNVTQLVDRLEADGLVSRTSDPNDRRSRLAVLTDAGRKAYATGSDIQSQAERELFGVLTPDESDALHQLLAKLQA
jgi:DNA-binding MarR family transcriptional regulator